MRIPFGAGSLRGRTMVARTEGGGSPLPETAGLAVALAGLGFVGVGIWARRDVRRALAQERIVSPEGGGAVKSAAAARSLAELIRRHTLSATGGRTYAEVDAYVGENGEPTGDAASALKDDRTGQPLESPDHELWLQSTTLQTALMQAYVSFRLAELTVALGAAFLAAGAGLAAAGRRLAAR